MGEIKDPNRGKDEPVVPQENFGQDPNIWVKETSDRLNDRERGLEAYEAYLGFKREELEGKDVLDLGSGSTEKFLRELKEAGINANVIPLNPDFSIEKLRKKLETTPGWQGKTVAATAQEMPFKDESFDQILALYSVTVHSNPLLFPAAAKKWMSEIVRVLKPGGEARLAPVGEFSENEEGVRSGEFEDLLSSLEEQGLEIKIEMIKNKALGVTKLSTSWTDRNGVEHEKVRDVGEHALCGCLIIKKSNQKN